MQPPLRTPLRTASRALLGLALTGGVVLGPALPALAAPPVGGPSLVAGAADAAFAQRAGMAQGPVTAAGTGSTTVPVKADAWYRTEPTCALPTGCVLADQSAPSPYAAQTLHVAVNLGAEDARSYLALDLTALPEGTKPAGGQLRLPVASGAQDGTVSPETAKIKACLLLDDVKDVDGTYETPPEPDCTSASMPAVFVPASGTTPAAFTIDLAPFAKIWQTSVAPGALALLPGDDLAATDTWHVAFSRKGRTGDGVSQVTAAMSFLGTAVSDDVEVPEVQAPIDGGTAVVPDLTPVDVPTTPVPPSVALPTTPTTTAPPAAQPASVPVAQVLTGGFAYPGVFLAPIGLVALLAWLGRALTRDLSKE